MPSRFASERSISETEPPSLQRMPLHLQRFVMFLRDHELRRGDDDDDDDGKLVFHLTKASASVLDEDDTFEGNGAMRKTQMRKRYVL